MCEPISPWRVSFSGYTLLEPLAEPSRAAERGTHSAGEQTAAGLWQGKGKSRLARKFRFSRITVKWRAKKACLWTWVSSITVFSPLHRTGSAVPSGNPLLCLAVKQGKKNTKYIWGNNHKMWKHMHYILNLWDSLWFTLKPSQPGGDYLDWVLLMCELK